MHSTYDMQSYILQVHGFNTRYTMYTRKIMITPRI